MTTAINHFPRYEYIVTDYSLGGGFLRTVKGATVGLSKQKMSIILFSSFKYCKVKHDYKCLFLYFHVTCKTCKINTHTSIKKNNETSIEMSNANVLPKCVLFGEQRSQTASVCASWAINSYIFETIICH